MSVSYFLQWLVRMLRVVVRNDAHTPPAHPLEELLRVLDCLEPLLLSDRVEQTHCRHVLLRWSDRLHHGALARTHTPTDVHKTSRTLSSTAHTNTLRCLSLSSQAQQAL
jgi:hypothetical protein